MSVARRRMREAAAITAWFAFSACCAGGLALSPARATAEVGGPGAPTVQARAADATWLAYTPPPVQPGVVCMVDSGVDPNPDTEAAVIGGQAIAPETGTNDELARLDPRVQPGDHPDGHGTVMAMVMAAPRNGWGMVGLAPTSVRVYNMKALPRGATTFPFAYYAVGIEECRQLHAHRYPSMAVINLSLGGARVLSIPELARLDNFTQAAHSSQIDVVGAAGNEAGTVLYPAADPSIFAVGAGDVGASLGSLCAFASRGEGLDLVAPGCDTLTGGLEVAFEDDGSPAVGSGSSQASAIVAATLASMRAYDPLLSWSQAEGCLTGTARGGALDVRAAFDACGLEAIVAAGEFEERSAEPPAGVLSTTTVSAAPKPPSGRLVPPAPSISGFESSGRPRPVRCRRRPARGAVRSYIRPVHTQVAKAHRRRRPMACRKCASLASGRRSPASLSRCLHPLRRPGRARTRSKPARGRSAT
jgi:hypothetical protein